MKIRNRSRMLVFALVFMAILGTATMGANAGPGQGQNGASNGNTLSGQTGKRVEYLAQSTYRMTGTTPTVSAPVCGLYGDRHALEVQYVGTMPAGWGVTVQMWNSIDGGTHRTNVGTAVAINGTVTPATSRINAADVSNGLSSSVYGDCWGYTLTWAGTAATTTANLGIYGFDK